MMNKPTSKIYPEIHLHILKYLQIFARKLIRPFGSLIDVGISNKLRGIDKICILDASNIVVVFGVRLPTALDVLLYRHENM
jgi:hypothetical protein